MAISNARRANSVLILSATGLFLSGYLAFLSIALLRGELLGGVLCGDIGSVLNCHAVAASRFSKLFGVPLALWGILGYLATAALAVIARQFESWATRTWICLAGLSLLFLGVDLFLGWMMATEIRHLCLFCLGTYAVNFGLFVIAWDAVRLSPMEIIRQFPKTLLSFLRPNEAAPLFFIGILLMAGIGILTVHSTAVFFSKAPEGYRQRMEDRVRTASRMRVNTEGDPIRGALGGSIQMVEFTDLLCPTCQEAARFNEIILSAHPGEVAWIAKHFPLDQSCNDAIDRTVHPGACALAVASECAHAQGKFWEFHDRVMRHGLHYPFEKLEEDAAGAGLNLETFRACLSSGQGLQAVKRDIDEAKRLGVVATPTYFVNGIEIRGAIVPSAFDEMATVFKEKKRKEVPSGNT